MLTPGTIATFTEAPPRVSSHAGSTEEYIRGWFLSTGIVANQKALARAEASNLGRLAAAGYPDADANFLRLQAEWYGWWFTADSYNTTNASVDEWLSMLDRLELVVKSAGTTDDDPHPLVRTLAQICRSTRGMMSAGQYRRLGWYFMYTMEAMGWESRNRETGVVPLERQYVPLRRRTVGMGFYGVMLECLAGVEVPAEVEEAPRWRELVAAAGDVVAWQNDVFSYRQEMTDGEPHNLVRVLEVHHDMPVTAAVEAVNSRIAGRVEDFRRSEAALPELMSELGVAPASADRIMVSLHLVKLWINSGLWWYDGRTSRYDGTAYPGNAYETDTRGNDVDPAVISAT